MKRTAGIFHAISKHTRGCPPSPTVALQRLFSSLHSRPSISECDVNACEGALDFGRWHNGGGYFHKSAVVDPTARIDMGAVVHSEAVLCANVHIGSGAVVGPSVSIGESTKIGKIGIQPVWLRSGYTPEMNYDYIILSSSSEPYHIFLRQEHGYWSQNHLSPFPSTGVTPRSLYNAALSNCSVGMSCIIHNGVCIGQDGFGFFVDEEGSVKKKPQMLYARIGNDVEIGANTCIDRGSWRDTSIGDHSKIDNLVQIGHNVIIGKGCILCGQVGIAGSVTIGDYVTMGGRAAVRDHVSIVSKVRLAGNTCVTKDILSPGDYAGFPAVPAHEWRRQLSKLQRFCQDEAFKR